MSTTFDLIRIDLPAWEWVLVFQVANIASRCDIVKNLSTLQRNVYYIWLDKKSFACLREGTSFSIGKYTSDFLPSSRSVYLQPR